MEEVAVLDQTMHRNIFCFLVDADEGRLKKDIGGFIYPAQSRVSPDAAGVDASGLFTRR